MKLLGVLMCTLCALEGSRIYPSSTCQVVKIKSGRVRYRQNGRIARFICNTGYTLAGDRYSVCDHGRWDIPFPKCVRATCAPVPPLRNGLIYPSHGGGVMNFYCKSNYQVRGPNITYCNGTMWDNPIPTCLPTNSTPSLSCDFEQEDLCGWNHDLNHDFEWKRLNYATPSGAIGTGPSHDHTKGVNGDGYYMYIESSARNVNDKARLISPVYDKNLTNNCFQFFYHMYGLTTGSLRVYVKKVNDTWNLTADSAVFSKSGNQGNRWYRALLELGPINDDFQIVIEGVRGTSYVSDIAIDDVKLIRNCTPEEESTTTEEPTTSEMPPVVESCFNRCNKTDEQVIESVITCDCDDSCYLHNRCCPDYFDYCVLVSSSYDFTESTSDFFKRTTPTITTTTTKRVPSTNKRREATTTLATRKTTPISDDVEIPPVVNDIPKASSEVETPVPPPVKEAEPINDYANDKTDHQKITVVHKPESSNYRTIVFGVGVVFGTLLTVVGTAFVAKRYHLCQCGRLNQSTHGDSQSDVRFLTSDEIIDFSLATDYDTL